MVERTFEEANRKPSTVSHLQAMGEMDGPYEGGGRRLNSRSTKQSLGSNSKGSITLSLEFRLADLRGLGRPISEVPNTPASLAFGGPCQVLTAGWSLTSIPLQVLIPNAAREILLG